jgi:transposase-like protein
MAPASRRKFSKKAKKGAGRRAKAKQRRARRRLKAEKKKRKRIPVQKKYDIVQEVLRNGVATIKNYPYRPSLIGKWITQKDDIKYTLDIKPKAMNIIKRTMNEGVREPAEEPVADRLEQLRAEVAEVKELLTSKENMEKIIDGMDELRI